MVEEKKGKAGRPASKELSRTERLYIYVNTEEKETIRAAAAVSDVTVNIFTRQAALKKARATLKEARKGDSV